jgi:MraZ protein
MFLGQYEHSIDEKGRLTIPVRYRELLEHGAYITQGFDQNLVVFTASAFEQVYASLNSSSLTDPKARLLRRLLFSQADKAEVDKAGRMLIPQFLRLKNGLDGSVVVVGNGTYFEVWSKTAWAEQEEMIHDATANEDRFAALDLLIHPQ